MSGFEVAGIILGSIPLVISALEHYRDGASAIRRWSRYEIERRNLILRLETESIKMQNICAQLLRGIVWDLQIEDMIRNPFGTAWQEPTLQRQLQRRLHGSARVFEATAGQVKDAIQEILRQLDFPQQGKREQSAMPSAVRREFRRIVFTLSRSSYSSKMDIIKDGICSLDVLTAQCISLEPGRLEASQAMLAQLFRGLAMQLHQALKGSLSCSCSHNISMKLSTRSPDTYDGEDAQDFLRSLDMDIALSFLADCIPAAELRGNQAWVHMRTYALPNQASVPNVPIQADADVDLHIVGIPIGQTEHGLASSMDRMQIGQASTATLIRSANIASLANPMAFSANPVQQSPETIRNLCEMVQKSWERQPADGYGFIATESERARRHFKISPSDTPWQVSDDSDMICLQDIMQKQVKAPALYYKQKMTLAVTIATAVVQLHNTPWLPARGLSAAIVFSRKDLHRIYENPFLVESEKRSGKELASRDVHVLMRNSVMVSLGVLLIELVYGPMQLSAGDDMASQYCKAQEALPALYSVSKNYFSAVSRCLDDSDLHSPETTEENFQRLMQTRVVSLLQADLDIM